MGRVKQIWYLSPMRAAKVQASLRIRAVSPEPSLLAHTSSESRGTFRQKARSLAPLNGWACAVKICHDGMLEDTILLDAAQMCPWVFLISVMSENFARACDSGICKNIQFKNWPVMPQVVFKLNMYYCYLFLLSVFIIWFTYYVSDIF